MFSCMNTFAQLFLFWQVIHTSNATFWAGADIGTVLRAETIPGRVFYDFDGTTVKDPIVTLGDAGFNAFRVESGPGQCLGPTTFDNSRNSWADNCCTNSILDVSIHKSRRHSKRWLKA